VCELLTETKKQAVHAVEAALTKGALEPVLLDVSKSANYTDYVVIVSAKNPRQCKAIAQAVQTAMHQIGSHTVGVEGQGECDWWLLDYGDMVVHVFTHPTRLYYDLEGLWSDAPRAELDVPPAQRRADLHYESGSRDTGRHHTLQTEAVNTH